MQVTVYVKIGRNMTHKYWVKIDFILIAYGCIIDYHILWALTSAEALVSWFSFLLTSAIHYKFHHKQNRIIRPQVSTTVDATPLNMGAYLHFH